VTESPEKVLARIGYLPDVPPLYGEMTVLSFLGFAAKLRQVPSRGVDGRVADAARKCALEGVIDQRIDTLSYGYKKRVGIAQAIVHGPPLVILDEPIAGLDPAQIVGIRELLRGLRGEHTILISSHILSEISQICDRIFVMHDGRIVASGSEDKLSERLGEAFSLRIKVKGDRERAVSVIQGISGVESCQTTGEEGGVASFEVGITSDVRAALSRALVEAGLGLLELRRRRDQLESVFLDLTGPKGEA
jgi:ABC-2 type transport system ATP-binding protein